jgi:hypothetical protein
MKKIATPYHYRYEDLVAIKRAQRVEEIVQIAMEVISRMPESIYFVMGPITSGVRPIEENRKRLHDTIMWLKDKGADAFDYIPLRKKAVEILQKEFGTEDLTKSQKYML